MHTRPKLWFLIPASLVALVAALVIVVPSFSEQAEAQQVYEQPIQLNQHVSGTLDGRDARIQSGEFVDWYVYNAQAGENVRVRLSSAIFDTYIMVRGQGVQSDNDDMGPGITNSELNFTATQAGPYRIGVTSYQPGEVGAYTLQVTPGGAGGAGAPVARGQIVGGSQSVTVGQTQSGSLQAGDPQLQSGEYYDRYEFQGRAGQQLTVTMTSTAIDAYIMLRGMGVTLDNDDAPGMGTNSQLVATLPADGAYAVYATSYQPGESGPYSITIDGAGGAGTSAQNPPYGGAPTYGTTPTYGGATSVSAGTISVGQSVQGQLDSADTRRTNGQYYETWTMQGNRGQRVIIELSSAQFDTYLRIRSPDGGGEENDDIDLNGGNLNSRIDYTLPMDGTYEITATSYAAGSTGSYQLSVQPGGFGAQPWAGGTQPTQPNYPPMSGQPTQPSPGSAASSGRVMIDRPVQGQLQAGDPQLQSGEYYDSWEFQVEAGQEYTLTATSSTFDTWIEARGPGSFEGSNDDGVPGTTNARLSFRAPESGIMQVHVTSYRPGETGAYELSAVRGALNPTVGGGPSSSSVAASSGGRIVAVLAGITDYGGSGDLMYCAQDARNIHEELRATGQLAPESVVLTDAQVTRAGLEQAFQRAAAAMRPNDVFMFFYSGHGDRQQSSDPTEIDGYNETLYVRDGHITDDQMASWFDSIGGRMQIIALDSCYSGGFARDIITSDTRLGFFSSEEDVTSNVASRFQAGGYLSHFLRESITQIADRDPTDGMITVGEMTQHVRRQWAQHMQSERVTTDLDEMAYQNLVIERGAKVSDVVIGPRSAR